MSIILNSNLEHRISVQVESGRYRSPSEVIQEGLNLLEARDAMTPGPVAAGNLPIWNTVALLGASIADGEWSQVPSDLASDLDRHLYGSSKRPE